MYERKVKYHPGTLLAERKVKPSNVGVGEFTDRFHRVVPFEPNHSFVTGCGGTSSFNIEDSNSIKTDAIFDVVTLRNPHVVPLPPQART